MCNCIEEARCSKSIATSLQKLCPYDLLWLHHWGIYRMRNVGLQYCQWWCHSHFLFACYATLHLTLSVRWSVGPSHFTFLRFLRSLASLLLPKRSGDLKYGPFPSARDWGSRVSGLVPSKDGNAQRHYMKVLVSFPSRWKNRIFWFTFHIHFFFLFNEFKRL